MALVEGNAHGGESANDEQTEQGAPAIPDEAVAQMLGHVSDRASVQGGKVIDIGEVFIQAIAGQDTIVGESDFEEQSGMAVESLVEAVRESAREQGVEDDRNLHMRMVDKVPVEGYGGVDGLAQRKTRAAFVRHHPEDVQDWALTTIHEASHLIAKHEGGDQHDEEWRRVYVEAVRRVFGDEVADAQDGFYAD